jgi:hypothetical protein
MANAGSNIACTTTPDVVFNTAASDLACTVINVTNLTSSADVVQAAITPLHNAGEFATILPGQSLSFKAGGHGISKVTLTSPTTATANWSVLDRE